MPRETFDHYDDKQAGEVAQLKTHSSGVVIHSYQPAARIKFTFRNRLHGIGPGRSNFSPLLPEKNGVDRLVLSGVENVADFLERMFRELRVSSEKKTQSLQGMLQKLFVRANPALNL